MTRSILDEIAKSKKINLALYDHVFARINDNYTKILVTFFNLQVCPMGGRGWCNTKDVALNIYNIVKKGERIPEDYETNGSRWIFEIR